MTGIIYDPYKKKPLEDFLSEFVFEVEELPDEIAMHYIRKAAIEFAQRSRVIRRKVLLDTQTCVENYILESPDCMSVVAIHSICKKCNTNCGRPIRLTHNPCRIPFCTTYSWYEEPNILWIKPSHGCNTYEVEISVAPMTDACELDEVFYTEYYETILTGARMYIYGMPRKDWSDKQLSVDLRHEFDRRIGRAMEEKLMGRQVGAIRARIGRVI